ncbi:MAG TPA: prepilin-type N-terminal cleavage/methylation domain-containing protein [Oligoflexus sp.]|uniref:PulJ/GspJ family protein n=1 Tax=Oligoflexus sp. TaxID=1971216 RepID=UPI002D3938BA|nr:prepilin-type N-terminal cleavage/methylation domain-containing protein [Oligoflexus sp.]HYX34801.1 prepilin-type N-terminal cleavage/methylation domain-containing protein [Oligoflexus sp.]
MKVESNSGFSLVEMLIAVALLGLIGMGVRQMMLRAQQSSMRDNLRKNHADVSQELSGRLNHYFKRHTARTVSAPNQLSLTLPSGVVVIETICVKNDLAFQAPDALLNRCKKCDSSQRQVTRIQAKDKTQLIPSGTQKPDMPAAASVCFKNGSDPDEVEIITELLVVDPITRTDKKVSKFESLLIKDASSFTSFE